MQWNDYKREFEYKVINKHLMISRGRNVYNPPVAPLGQWSNWKVEANIFETVKAFLLWNYNKELLPLSPPYFNEDAFPQLEAWYQALSNPNSPLVRILKVSPEEYKQWLLTLDLSKPFSRSECDKVFEVRQSRASIKDVDAVEIAENENREVL